MVSALKDPLTFNDLMVTSIYFSKYMLNVLKIENLTQDTFLGPAFNLLKGTCSSSIELEYNFQKCFNALTDKLDWNNPEGDHVTYTTSITKTKAARYEIKGIEDMVSKFSNQTVYSTKAILGVKSNDIEDMLLLAVQHQSYSTRRREGERYCWTLCGPSYVHKKSNPQDVLRSLPLSVESYQKKLIITKPQKTFPEIEFKEPYTPSYDPPGIVYEDLNKQKRVL
ncbi:hypothetical protein Tco_0679488 [Tanacetum coccineum]|uniref:Uncharacterized protein n=1 Tax=Tanacetum coccineum TaxID=301880 RepID=A0ABQ4XI02_9ASTR